MGTTPVDMYKLFFGSQEMCPDLTEDAGLSCNRSDTQVSSPVPRHVIRIFIIKLPLKEPSLKQEWIAKAKLIRCPAPLPETTSGTVLVRMLEAVPSKESEGGDKEAIASLKEVVRKREIENSSPRGKKRTASEDLETMASKRGKKSSPEGPASGEAPAAQSPLKSQPSNEP